MRLAVIIPTYNEKDNIERIVREVLDLGIVSFLLVVDDSSPDGTGNRADKLAAADVRVRVLHRPKKQGLGAAYVAGFRSVIGLPAEKIITMDADFSHDPKDIPRLVGAAANSDIIVGSRYIPGGAILGWDMRRKLLSWVGTRVARILLGLKVRDCTAGFKCYDRRFLESLDLNAVSSQGYAFQVEMLFFAKTQGYSVREIPITFRERTFGKSKVDLREIGTFAVSILGLAFRRLLDL
ncbi:MAG: polyprenol monophosphomannose synthase [Parcubacteria group bacterium]|nr:polyprenol monophosphomannose synthase [Parcubacteria group bacterium]